MDDDSYGIQWRRLGNRKDWQGTITRNDNSLTLRVWRPSDFHAIWRYSVTWTDGTNIKTVASGHTTNEDKALSDAMFQAVMAIRVANAYRGPKAFWRNEPVDAA